MNKMSQEAPQVLRRRMYNRDSAKPKEKQILVLKTGLAGAQFHIESEEEREALNNITPGTELLLYREPDNAHDEWAIAVYLTEDDLLGYISRFKNETIARLMDAGKKFIAIVDEPEVEIKPLPNSERVVTYRNRRTAPTENLAIPFSVYMIE